MTIEHLGDLTPDSKNARRHNPRNVGMIVDALHEVGAARSIVIDEHGKVLAGNATIEAAAQAGIERVQVVDADGETLVAVRRTGLTEEQKTRLALYDNRTAELADWDPEALAGIMADDGALDGLFSDLELVDILGDLLQPEAVEHAIGRGGRLYEGHDIEAFKLAHRVEAAWQARGSLALDLYSGEGQLAEWYRRRFERVVTVDRDAQHETDYILTVEQFIARHLDEFMAFDFVDFDDEGSPAREIEAFFDCVAGKKRDSFILALTDGSGLSLKLRGPRNLVLYPQGGKATQGDYVEFEETVIQFVTACARQAGFEPTRLSSYRRSNGNVIYQTWLIETQAG